MSLEKEIKGVDGNPEHEYDLRGILDEFHADLERLGRSEATVKAYCRDVIGFIQFLVSEGHDLDIRSVDAEMVERWDATKAGKLQASSRNRKMASLGSFFDFARKRRYITEDPMDLVERAKELDKEAPCPTEGELGRILDAEENPDWRLLFRFMSETGLRRSEAIELLVGDLDLDAAKVHVRNGKGGKSRVVPVLKDDLMNALREHVAGVDSGRHLFRASQGGKISASRLWERFKRAVKRAGLQDKGFTPHSLRHYFATRKLAEGHKIHTVQRWAGHSDPSMILKTYAHVQEEDENAMVAASAEAMKPVMPSPSGAAALSAVPSMPAVVYAPVNGVMVPLPVLGVVLMVAAQPTIEMPGTA
ncbi:MAG: tyrosine-type recombinase/integrase [Armatimonadota bacterium]